MWRGNNGKYAVGGNAESVTSDLLISSPFHPDQEV
jgi:hypothetical protein